MLLDEPFITVITVVLEKCKQFVVMGILPEVVGKWYTKEPIISLLEQEAVLVQESSATMEDGFSAGVSCGGGGIGCVGSVGASISSFNTDRITCSTGGIYVSARGRRTKAVVLLQAGATRKNDHL